MIQKLIPDPPHTTEETLIRIFDLLRSAAAVMYESGDQQSGTHRHLAFAALYLVDMAKALADHQIQSFHEPRTA